MTIQLEISAATQALLNYERYHHPVPLVQRRMEALWLKSHSLAHAEIAKLVGISENTLRDYFELYQQGGVEGLKAVNFYRPQSELDAHIPTMEAYFRVHPPASIKEAQHHIEQVTGIHRSETQVREFLKKNSISVAAKSE